MKKFLIGIVILLAIGSISVYFLKASANKNNTVVEEVKSQNAYNEKQENLIQKIKKNPALCDEIFSEYVKTLEEEVNNLNENLPTEIASKFDVSQIDPNIIEDYRMSGIDFACQEGSCYARVGYKYLYDLFNHILTPEYNEYLLIKAEENNEPYASDGGIVVPFETIRKRFTKSEEFLKKYPDFIHNDDIKENINMYYYAYKNGLDNTPVKCSKEEKVSDPERTMDISRSYAIYLKEAQDKESEYYKEIENCYNKIR